MTKPTAHKAAPKALYVVRASPIHGRGVFASRHIAPGQRILEYTGERITPQEADTRYDDDSTDHPHILLFTVDKHTVIDGAVGGSAAKYINHSCEPNCEAVNDDGRIFIESIRDVARGEELTYDYKLERAGRYRAEWAVRYQCHCGAPSCRGSMLALRKRRSKKK